MEIKTSKLTNGKENVSDGVTAVWRNAYIVLFEFSLRSNDGADEILSHVERIRSSG